MLEFKIVNSGTLVTIAAFLIRDDALHFLEYLHDSWGMHFELVESK